MTTTARLHFDRHPPVYIADEDRLNAEVRAACRRGDVGDAVDLIVARVEWEQGAT